MEAIQTDIWVRLQKLKGHDCIYVCADDAHGTAIMLSAEALGITAEALINKVNKQHQEDYADFLIEFDNFHSTHTEENRALSESNYKALNANGHIARRNINQLQRLASQKPAQHLLQSRLAGLAGCWPAGWPARWRA